MIGLVEMAGNSHYTFIDDFLYIYYGSTSADPEGCFFPHMKYDAIKARLKTPYLELFSL